MIVTSLSHVPRDCQLLFMDALCEDTDGEIAQAEGAFGAQSVYVAIE